MSAAQTRTAPVRATEQAAELAAHAAEASAFLRAMANPNRLLVLCALGAGELSVGALNERIPLSQSALSQHLAVLREDGLVERRRESQTIYYSVAPGPAHEVMRVLYAHFCAGPGADRS